MDSDNRIQDVDVNSSTEVGQTEQKENEIVEKDQGSLLRYLLILS